LLSPEFTDLTHKIEAETPLPEGMLERLGWVVRIMTRLRAENGCPWDRAQDHKTLLKNLLEEAYEFIETVRLGDDAEMREELGDLFMQVVFHAEIAAERGAFHLGDVAEELTDKLLRRHPHVFGEVQAKDQDAALSSWIAAKQKEGWKEFALDEVPRAMPALLRARKVQEKVGQVGFEWPQADGALAKIDEELAEFREAVQSGDRERASEELGDLLFAVVNAARYVQQCPEVSLTVATDKFVRRFRHIESRLAEEHRTPRDATLEEMDRYWDEAKALERIQ